MCSERVAGADDQLIAAIEGCDHCGKCEEVCRYGLRVMEMLPKMLPAMRDMVAAYEAFLA